MIMLKFVKNKFSNIDCFAKIKDEDYATLIGIHFQVLIRLFVGLETG